MTVTMSCVVSLSQKGRGMHLFPGVWWDEDRRVRASHAGGLAGL